MRREIIVGVLCVALSSACRAQQAVSGGADVERLPIIEKYAAEHPEFHAKWLKTIEEGDPDAFLAFLGESSPRVQASERLPASTLAEMYVQSGMSPWITFADVEKPGTPVAPGGKLHLVIRANFSTFMDDRGRTASIQEVTVKPPCPQILGSPSTAWMPGRTTEGGPAIQGWVDQAVWLTIPAEAGLGPLELTLYALTEGSQNGSVVKETQKEQCRIRIVPPGQATRENALCVWAFGIDCGKALATATRGPKQDTKVRQSQLAWADALLGAFASEEGIGEFVKGLRKHKEYVKNVVKQLEGEPGGTARQGTPSGK